MPEKPARRKRNNGGTQTRQSHVTSQPMTRDVSGGVRGRAPTLRLSVRLAARAPDRFPGLLSPRLALLGGRPAPP